MCAVHLCLHFGLFLKYSRFLVLFVELVRWLLCVPMGTCNREY